MLYPSQQQSAAELTRLLAQERGAVAFEGLSGAGKSTVAGEALKDHPGAVVIDAGRFTYAAEPIHRAVRDRCHIVILAQPGDVLTRFEEHTPVHSERVILRGLSRSEVQSWLDQPHIALSDEEREIVSTYSLGLPLLIERFLATRPLTRATAITLCAATVEDLLNRFDLHSLFHDVEPPSDITKVLATYSDFPIPDDVFALLRKTAATSNSSPMALLTSRLRHGERLPTPATVQLFTIYQEWLQAHRDEPYFEVFIESMPDADEFVRTLGFWEDGEYSTNELSRFSMANTRKGTTYNSSGTAGRMSQTMNKNHESLDSWFREHMIVIARSVGLEAGVTVRETFGRFVEEINIAGLQHALFLHKHDHAPTSVMPVAYTTECLLQARKVPYVVSLNERLFRYDPVQNIYEPLDRVAIDYHREAYGHLWDEEQREPWEDEEELG